MRKIEDRLSEIICMDCAEEMELVIEAPAFKMRETMEDRLNTNYEKKMQRKATGEW